MGNIHCLRYARYHDSYINIAFMMLILSCSSDTTLTKRCILSFIVNISPMVPAALRGEVRIHD